MKKIFLLLTLLFSLSMNAQVKFGAKTGLNLAELVDWIETDTRTGMYVGVYLRVPIAKKLSLQPEVFYSSQGGEGSDKIYYYYNGILTSRNIEVKYKFDYINIPLLIQYEPVKGLRVEAGPQLGIVINEKAEINNKEELSTDIKNLDLSLPVGLNYELGMGLNISARYNLGLTNISKNSVASIKNSVIALGIGYTFK